MCDKMAPPTSEYENAKAKIGRLKLKGNKSLFKPRKVHKNKNPAKSLEGVDLDAQYHGGWRLIKEEADLIGGIDLAFELNQNPGCYLAASDNGRFKISFTHMAAEGPSPEEMLTLIKTPDSDKISLKTGYGKYVAVDTEGNLIAVADAIGSRERFIIVFEEGKTALLSTSSNLFLSLKEDKDGFVKVVNRKVQEDEIINIRTNAMKVGPVDWRSPEDKSAAGECEESYVKMFQHSKVDLTLRNISIDVNEKSSVKRAQVEGNLHETLLDRRVKTKSDKYC